MNTKKKPTFIQHCVGYVIAMPIMALILTWYNYVFLQYPASYPFMLILAVGVTVAGYILQKSETLGLYKIWKTIWVLILCSAVLLQALSWGGAISFPVLQLFQ